MTIRDYEGLITGRSAKLPGDYAQDSCVVVTKEQFAAAAHRLSKQVTLSTGDEDSLAAADDCEDDDTITLPLCWPPSVNHYWRHTINPAVLKKAFAVFASSGLSAALRVMGGAVMVYVSKEGKDFQKMVRSLVQLRFKRPAIDYEVSVLVEAWAPNRRSWDVSNRLKALEDAMTQAGVWTDDKLVRDVRIVDRGVEKPGRVVVSIRRFKMKGLT